MKTSNTPPPFSTVKTASFSLREDFFIFTLVTILFLIASTIAPNALANEPQTTLSFSSGDEATTVIELYTSQGCSSCPPADRWLSKFTEHPGLFEHIIPMAFHVDYWDYIGWKDPFASSRYSQRQRKLAKTGILKSVYTPGFVVNSKEWRQWFQRRASTPPAHQGTPGNLKATLNNEQLTVSFDPIGDVKSSYTLHIAYLGMGLTRKITAGENNRRELTNDFVVLDHWQRNGKKEWRFPLRKIPNKQQEKTAIALWITSDRSEEIIQATAHWLPRHHHQF
ncbi:DUF1223 domain-containing protein [Marinibactrum halimedae]|uniref:DUF1223 domain-containing protein n=1 Tax=Marinibactrum halimedae TaxID=1444977 RepID=A0AA37T529_9GAMM|nr:DUF1223 domain-containing protein [Marinibactrum halimedae]MCD9460884.1 DUF1223 domain-containing protein [Marinibactrum halimedae]GLS27338.1 hypothetical protein GCM10007877_30570 [Marinibactrum halimedae]